MSFKNSNLAVIAYANGFTMWQYTTKDSFEEVIQNNYFEPVKTLMNTGDTILINCYNEQLKSTLKSIVLENGNVKLQGLL